MPEPNTDPVPVDPRKPKSRTAPKASPTEKPKPPVKKTK